MILQSIAISGWDTKLVAGAQQETQSSLGVKSPFFLMWVTVCDFQRSRLAIADGKDLGTRPGGFWVLDALWRQNETAHNVTDILIINVGRDIERLTCLSYDLSFGLFSR